MNDRGQRSRPTNPPAPERPKPDQLGWEGKGGLPRPEPDDLRKIREDDRSDG